MPILSVVVPSPPFEMRFLSAKPTLAWFLHVSSVGISTQSYDFGTLEATHVALISAPFNYRNTTDQPLTITQLRPSCGCPAALLVPKTNLPLTLKPGASLQITVNIDSSHLNPGSIDKSVSIYAANHADPVATLHVTGTILPPVAFSPSLLDLGSSAQQQTRPLSLIYDDSLDADGSSVALVSRDPSITIDPAGRPQSAPVVPSWSPDAGHARHLHTFTVHFDPGHTIGNLTGRLVAVRQTKTGPDIELGDIPYYANVAGDFHALPTVVVFGMVEPGKPATQTFQIQGKNLDKLTATSTVSYLSVKLGPVHYDSGLTRPFGAPLPKQALPQDPNHESVDAIITLSSSVPTGPIQSSVSIKSADGQELTVPVYALIGTPK